MDLLPRFEASLKESLLIQSGEKVYVACSGGPDSTALFFLLHALKEKWKLRLGLMHINHQLRGRDSQQDEKFVRQLAKKSKVPVLVSRKKITKSLLKKASLEEAAREIRYQSLVALAKHHRISKVAMGHTREDQAETVLMRILQGTGLRGLLGIRDAKKIGRIVFVRPLLDFSKKELLIYLKASRTSFREDKTNRSKKFLRNRLRFDLLPKLQREFNPRVIEALARLPRIVQQENHFLQGQEEKSWKEVFKTKRRGKVSLNLQSFKEAAPVLQFRLLNRALQSLDSKSGLNFELWQSVKRNLQKKRLRVSLPRGIEFEVSPGVAKLYKKNQG